MRNYQLPEYQVGRDLRDLPKDATAYFQFLKNIEKDLQQNLSSNDRLAALEVYAIASRRAGQLNSAELSLKVAIQICEKENYPEKLLQNKIRLAHVFQWKRSFDRANDLFLECEKQLNSVTSPALVAAFWQHKGKNLFDQEFYELSAECFQKALDLRLQTQAPEDQIESSRFALEVAQERMASVDPLLQ